MPTALFLLANGFEEFEFIAPYDILHRGGIEVITCSISSEKVVKGAHDLEVIANFTLSDAVQIPNFDLLILPGGGKGTENLLASEFVKNLIIKSYGEKKLIAAICAATKVLANAGILKEHSVTSFPDVRSEVEKFCKKYLEVNVVIDENIITSRGAGTAAEFGFALLSLLSPPENAREIKGKMQF